MRRLKRFLPITLGGLLVTALGQASFAAPTVLYNVKGYTIGSDRALHTFSALAFEQHKILARGGNKLANKYPGARRIDGRGLTLLPGLTDAHGHIMGLGFHLLQVDLRGVKSARAGAARVADYGRNHTQLRWLKGGGWNQVLWAGKQYPTKVSLDAVLPQRPVWLRRVDGHAGWANSAAMLLAGITRRTVAPAGGKIARDAQGNPTGIFIDNAMALIESAIPAPSKKELMLALDRAEQRLLSVGLTSVHDAGIGWPTYTLYQTLAKQHRLKIRIYAMVAATSPRIDDMLNRGYVEDPNGYLDIRSVKVYADGALGSRGAALLQDYSDKPGSRGLMVTSKSKLDAIYKKVFAHHFQLNIHAIGDRGNRIALDLFQKYLTSTKLKQLRNRIEHAQVVSISDIPRFKSLGIIPSMQPTHATSDMNMAEDRIGPVRLKGAYAWRTFLDQGSRIAAGSDFPVEFSNPFYGIHAAVTRQNRHNQPPHGWHPEQAMTVVEALRAFTLDAAFAAHEEKTLGSLEPGKWADFILVNRDPIAGRPQDLWKTTVLQTWVGGRKVYQHLE